MPNWCRNEVIIRSTDHAKLKRILSAAEEGKLLEHLRPYTEDTNYEWDYDWCVKNWGTKWDTGELIYAELSPCVTQEDVDMFGVQNDGVWELCMDFETAWSPPLDAFEYGAETIGFEFKLYYIEEGVGFVGCCSYIPDEGIDDECHDLYYFDKESLPSEEEYLEMFPYHIVEHFNMELIYQDLAENEEEDRLVKEEMAGVGNA